MGQATETSLQAARDALVRRAWDEARDLFHEAEKSGPLAPADLEQLAEAAWWSGHLDERDDAFERAYAAYLEAGKRLEAATMACSPATEGRRSATPATDSSWPSRTPDPPLKARSPSSGR
jgi:hypothetical protein